MPDKTGGCLVQRFAKFTLVNGQQDVFADFLIDQSDIFLDQGELSHLDAVIWY